MTTLPYHPFRFGVLNFTASTGADSIARAQRIESLGYSTFLLSDHVFNFAPITGMIVAAQATSYLRVGSYVLANDFWHPAMLAREALAIDLISGGRLEFGLGSGFYSGDYAQSGIHLDPPGVRISRLEESVQILRGLLSGETVTFHGKYYNIDQLSLTPKPVQHPHPPILIGGGSRRVLSMAARQADIVSFNIRTTPEGGFDHPSVTLEATRQKVEWVCQAAGERLPELEFNMVVPSAFVTQNQEQAVREITGYWKSMSVDQVLDSPVFLVGDVEQIEEKLHQNRERFGFSYYVIFEDALEGFAPVVQRLAGV